MPGSRLLSAQVTNAEMLTIMTHHANRGARLQILLRVILLGFLIATLIAAPPTHYVAACYAIVIIYPVAAALAGWWLLRGDDARRIQHAWLPLAIDVAVLGTLTLLAGRSADDTWTAYILTNGFYLLPLLAATQLRPRVAFALAIPTVGVYLITSIASRQDNGEPWSSVILRTAVLIAIEAGAILLSRIQRSRVMEIGQLAALRADLLGELTSLETRERQALAETLHDGALQYVLGARLDLEDARSTADADSFDRVDDALTQSAQLLRSTVSELHPAVLEQSGLPRALDGLLDAARARSGLRTSLAAPGWSDDYRTSADATLYSAARELITNVVKHAHAKSLDVTLERVDDTVTLTVRDDGTGTGTLDLQQRLADGHIGLASHRLRVEAAGGRLTLRPNDGPGTTAEVSLQVPAG